jgi:hypothetical protein
VNNNNHTTFTTGDGLDGLGEKESQTTTFTTGDGLDRLGEQ